MEGIDKFVPVVDRRRPAHPEFPDLERFGVALGGAIDLVAGLFKVLVLERLLGGGDRLGKGRVLLYGGRVLLYGGRVLLYGGRVLLYGPEWEKKKGKQNEVHQTISRGCLVIGDIKERAVSPFIALFHEVGIENRTRKCNRFQSGFSIAKERYSAKSFLPDI